MGTGPLVLLPSPVVSGHLLTPVSTMHSVILITPRRTQGSETQAVAAIPQSISKFLLLGEFFALGGGGEINLLCPSFLLETNGKNLIRTNV